MWMKRYVRGCKYGILYHTPVINLSKNNAFRQRTASFLGTSATDSRSRSRSGPGVVPTPRRWLRCPRSNATPRRSAEGDSGSDGACTVAAFCRMSKARLRRWKSELRGSLHTCVYPDENTCNPHRRTLHEQKTYRQPDRLGPERGILAVHGSQRFEHGEAGVAYRQTLMMPQKHIHTNIIHTYPGGVGAHFIFFSRD